MKNLIKFLPITLLTFPVLAHAQRSLSSIFSDLSSLLNTLISFLVLLATVIFLWNMVKYIAAAGDEEKRKEARMGIIYGIIFLAVMVAAWGLVNVILEFIFGPGGGNFNIPGGPLVPGSGLPGSQ
jgi:succinate dehydrogenase hydrophobic anchor subunit